MKLIPIIFLALLLVLQTGSAQYTSRGCVECPSTGCTWPRCVDGCAASDLYLNPTDPFFLKNITSCSGTNQTAEIWVNFWTTRTNAYWIYIAMDIYTSNGTEWTMIYDELVFNISQYVSS